MLSARSFLVRGLLAGLVAGIAAFFVAFVVGEPSRNAGIALESVPAQQSAPGQESQPHSHGPEDDAAPGHSHAPDSEAEEAVVPRSLQSTAGLLTGTVVAGVTLGGLVGVLSALALGRFGTLGARSTALMLATFGFVAVYLIPTLAYPPSPPSVGSSATIGYRTALYFILMAISVIALVVSVLVGRRLAVRWGGWYATLASGAGYLLVTLTALALLPTFNEVPESFPAVLLYEFRRASLLIQLTLWAVLGLVLAELTGRLTDRAAALDPTRPAPVAVP